jgi:hypothetical protein
VNFIHAWGEIQGKTSDGIALDLSGWEASSLIEEYITGTLQIKDSQVQLLTQERTLNLNNPPSDIPDGFLVGIQGVILAGNPPTLNWKFIETGEIPFSYGASISCGGGGGGGAGNSSNADVGGVDLHFPTLIQELLPATQAPDPYQPGDLICLRNRLHHRHSILVINRPPGSLYPDPRKHSSRFELFLIGGT